MKRLMAARALACGGLLALAACGGGDGGSTPGTPAGGAPSVVAQPQGKTVVEGQSARLSVEAGGTAPLGFQWQRNGADIPGATGAAYVTSTLQPADSPAQYRVRVTNGAGSAVSDAATVQVVADTALPAPATQMVAPSVTGTGIDDRFGQHVVARNPAVSANGLLFVFFPGTGANPGNYRLIVQAAANNGFAAIGLAYPNDSTVTGACLGRGDADCTRKIREETLSGADTSPLVAVNPANAVQGRLLALLRYLAQQQPQNGWDRFFDANGNLLWSLIRTGGHSQGGGTAVFASKRFLVDRSCFFASPADTTDGQTAVAPWVQAPGATGGARLFGFGHLQDGIVPPATAQAEWAALQLGSLGPLTSVDGAAAPYGASHTLTTNAPRPNLLGLPGLAFHNIVVVDASTPTDAAGLPGYRKVWQYLCFAP